MSEKKLHPRLRVMSNCNQDVAAFKSDLAATIATSISSSAVAAAAPMGIFPSLRSEAAEFSLELKERKRPPLGKRIKKAAGKAATNSFVNVFIELERSRRGGTDIVDKAGFTSLEATIKGEQERAAREAPEVATSLLVRRSFIAATVPISLLPALQASPEVAFVHPAEPLKFSTPAAASALTPTPRSVPNAALHGDGAGVIVGIIDVGGFDFAHRDFLNKDGTTRFLSIWDQGGDSRPPPAIVPGVRYGTEITAAQMNAAIAAAQNQKLPAAWLEPQSQMIGSSHGTHVASIAAGNKGVASKADIVGVLIDIPPENDQFAARRATFLDSSRIIHAVEYLLAVAEREKKPVSINISLGTNGGSHDGANGVSRWIDALLATAGRSITVAAGNAGQEVPESDDDIGFVMGRIHSTGRVPSRGLDIDLEWIVAGDGFEDMSENELEIWYSASDRLDVSVKPPGRNSSWMTVRPNQFIENKRLRSGTTVSIYNELYHPTNGANYAAIYLSPNYDATSYRGVEAGVWTVRLHGAEIRDGRFNCWIERDDPGGWGQGARRRLVRFPSFFSASTNVDSHSINSLACGHRTITVANLNDARRKINISSSQGPTRDGRSKPEVAAPGTDIVAANGFAPRENEWVSMTGTSMAAPYVAGVVALMLVANPSLTSAQCAGILQRTSNPLAGRSYEWTNDGGYGVINPGEAIAEAARFDARKEIR